MAPFKNFRIKSRLKSVKLEKDQSELERIALYEDDHSVRKLAVQKLENPDLIIKIAKNDIQPSVRKAAIKKISDQAVLADIVMHENDFNTATQAFKKIKEKALLAEIAKSDAHSSLRTQSISVLKDLKLLQELAGGSNKKKIKSAANRVLATLTPIYTMAKIEMRCPFCSQPVFVNGPMLSMKCHFCTSLIELNLKFWRVILKENVRGSGFGVLGHGYGFKDLDLQSEIKKPRCLKCGEKIYPGESPVESELSIKCPSCGHSNLTFPPPDWMKKISRYGRNAQQIYCGEREGEGDENIKRGMKPVITSCLQCGGNLKITVETPRNATCTYCGTVQYLPDPLWFSLHPMKIKQPWYIRWSPKGKTK